MTVATCQTIARPADGDVTDRGSRFLARARRVEDEPEARRVVDELRRRHHDARHTCSAFVLGTGPGQVQRSNDDGEPSGTAGAPILESITGRDLTDVVVVVTRWFGGTLLGAGGLVRAYGDAARLALDAAGTQPRELRRELTVTVPHAEAGRLEHTLRANGTITVVGVDYAAEASVRLVAPAGAVDDTLALLAHLTAGSGAVQLGGERWVDV